MATTKPPRSRAKAAAATETAFAAAPSTESTLYVNSVEKAMKVLTAFDGSKRHLSLSEIAAATGFDISAAQRFTFTLSALGYLLKDPQSKKYELSPKLLDFTYHYLVSNELVSRAAPYLQQLAAETEEATNLTVRLDTDIVFVLRIVSRSVFNANVIVGSRLPAYCTAPGLAMLATLDEAEIDDILARTNLVQFTPATVSQPRKIKERLARIRKQGYSHTEDEFFMGDISTAAAVVNQDGRAIGAINIAVPRVRWNAERDERRFADLVIQTAGALSARRRQEM
ncbi:IclR family transcriptional regulator [Pandoraea sp. NPDC087047]|uniref:IclR family transcriptional regulator n=1 Tax=Pandoraea sp. NPDC087047 TaxID=3364390 RepID=UPI00381C713F